MFWINANDCACVIFSQSQSALQLNNIVVVMMNILMNFNFWLEVLLETKVKSKLYMFPLKLLWLFLLLQVVKTGPTGFLLCMNGSTLDIDAHRLSDGGLLLSVDGLSYTTYLKEQVNSYRITIDNQTCTMLKENDPTILRLVQKQCFIIKVMIYYSCNVQFP